jgi:hypothetical protein
MPPEIKIFNSFAHEIKLSMGLLFNQTGIIHLIYQNLLYHILKNKKASNTGLFILILFAF